MLPRNQAASTMTQYPTHSHYLDTELNSTGPFLLMLNTRLGSDNDQFDKLLAWLDQEPNSWSPSCEPGTLYRFGHRTQSANKPVLAFNYLSSSMTVNRCHQNCLHNERQWTTPGTAISIDKSYHHVYALNECFWSILKSCCCNSFCGWCLLLFAWIKVMSTFCVFGSR